MSTIFQGVAPFFYATAERATVATRATNITNLFIIVVV
jgi:hypothetical protein